TLAALAAAAVTLTTHHASAHAVAGARIFVNTDLIDDPGVSDEANMPLISLQSPDGKSWITDANFEYDKTITPSLGFAVGTDWDFIARDTLDGNKTHAGFDDTYVQLKYRWIVLPEHEFISSVQVSQAFGRAGTVGIESGYNTTTVSGFFGKGLGDIPWAPIRPFALTGELDYNIPDTGPSGGGATTSWSGGLTLQYSIPYLQSQVKDYGIRGIAANLTPLVELAWTSSAGNTILSGFSTPTSFLLGTGAVWTGRYYAVSAEVLWPLNGAAGHNIGAIAQFHLYFDDLFPNTIGKPISEWWQ
ncbi:MAG TPA: hypothetical protein VME47_22785, partial [Acetobacteraceae bacterium]|nr:hypothetical protein [Acetobacteraceae bacterium]HUN43695.1 hypothetical protein [Acetobacteraceae bacterium]